MKQYQSPLEVAGRITDPSKYKGAANIILKGYKSERQRILENLQSEQFIKSNPVTPAEKVETKIEEKILPNRMYFKPRNNLERIKDELMQRHVNIEEIEGEQYNPQSKPGQKPGSSKAEANVAHKEEGLTPKQIFASLHHKTYFKAVKTVQSRSQASLTPSAKLDYNIIEGVKHSAKGIDLRPEELKILASEALKYCHVEDSQ
eukprot:CAMPEP_0202948908 /NCGR_PEP_ID=MMETSP1395-20130829/14763_1 /ASSEMBLY_ACC=CAM_ASM_000871 /TAXON_ID=5961 /ORGANISM="Blepharisma japonicum, Strain Stock R1072" /LENGTH=202 /DNA_ID=CAMNT_0049651453 /DNA_START=73 /DNA_END=678 /DNA_ORIENTATION=-